VDRPVLSLDRAFTYELDGGMDAGVGSLVEVLFHGRRVRGWILGPTDDVPPRMLGVRRVVSPVRFFDADLLALLRWVSHRYVAPLAAVIVRASPPRVASEEVRELAPPAAPADGSRGETRGMAPGTLRSYRLGAELLAAARGGGGAFVVRPAPEDAVSVAVEVVGEAVAVGRRAIVLVPEADPLPATASALVEAFGDRVALYLGGSKRERYRLWLDAASGAFDVVVGTRPAVFAPVQNLGVVYVSRESHPAHRDERSPSYHVREVALARSRITGAAAVMAAVFPSTEAAAAGAPVVAPASRRWPAVEVVRPGPEGRAPRLVAALRDARRAFLYEPLPGYGIAVVCRSCGRPAACAACRGVLRRERGAVRCIVCAAPGRCAECGADAFGIRRGGAERVEEWAAGLSSRPVRRAEDAGRWGGREEGILVGGPEAVRDIGAPALDLVGILDADLAARRPGMTALERSLSTWAEAAGWARPHGRVIVQSNRPNDPAVQSLVAGRPDRFHRFEAERRASAGFPVGCAVFRVAGSAELPAALTALDPITLLASAAGGETICLLALNAERVEAFGQLARELAGRGVLTRVDAEPHL
jgi:primosomal protein N' (replication factor Y) (superfamily II helicase)